MTEVKKKKFRLRRDIFSLLMSGGSDIWIHVAMVALCIYGTLMIASASMGLSVDDPMYLVKTVIKQVVFVIIGYIGMSMLSRKFSIELLRKPGFLVLMFAMEIILLACLAFPAVGGAHAWFRITIAGIELSLQPSEFCKIVSILIVAAYLGDVHHHFEKDLQIIVRPVAFILVYIFTVAILQDDFGSAAVIFVISCICMLIPQNEQLSKFQLFLRVCFWLLVAFMFFILSTYGISLIEHLPLSQYQIDRFLSAVNPFADQYGSGWQLIKGLISFATGGWFGVGFGQSVRKYTDFPAANTDYILSILVEELGVVGFAVLFILYGVIVFRLLTYAIRIKNEKAKIILVGTAMYFVVHIFLNVGGVTGLIPLTGVPLLMISSGGSSTLSIMLMVGIAQAVIAQYRRGEIE